MKKQLASLIEKLLIQKPITRNYDIDLIIDVWATESPESFHQDEEGRYYIYVDSLKALGKRLPVESITRARRKIQGENEELWPTDPKIRKRRRLKAEEISQTINSPDWHDKL